MKNSNEVDYAIEQSNKLFCSVDLPKKQRERLNDRLYQILSIYSDPTLVAFSDFEHMRMAGEISRDLTTLFSESFGIPETDLQHLVSLNTLAGFFHDFSNILVTENNNNLDGTNLELYLQHANGASKHPHYSAHATGLVLGGILDFSDLSYVINVINLHKSLDALGKEFKQGGPVVIADDVSTLVNYNRLLLSYTFNFLADIYKASGKNEKTDMINEVANKAKEYLKQRKNVTLADKLRSLIPTRAMDFLIEKYTESLYDYLDIADNKKQQELTEKLNNYIAEFHEVTDKGPVTDDFALWELKTYKGVDMNMYAPEMTDFVFKRIKHGPEESELFKTAISNAIILEEQIGKLFPGVTLPDYKKVEQNYQKLLEQ